MGALHTQSKPLILASASPRRQELLAGLGLSFDIVHSHADESVPSQVPPQQFVEILAERKAQAVLQRASRDVIVIGADTVVVLDGEILGKPRDADDAFAMLQRLQGATHTVYTGVCVLDAATGQRSVRHSATRVTMRPMTGEEIRRYIATGEPMDKAGAYAIQGMGATLVTHIEGDYFTVVGLPLALLAQMLQEFGVHVL